MLGTIGRMRIGGLDELIETNALRAQFDESRLIVT